MTKLAITAKQGCKYCHGTGFVSDWVDYGSTSVPLDSTCDCVTEQLPDDYDDDYDVIPAEGAYQEDDGGGEDDSDGDLSDDQLVFIADLPDVQEKAFGDSRGCVHFFTYALLSMMPGANAMYQAPANRIPFASQIGYMHDGRVEQAKIPWLRYGRADSEVLAAFMRFTDRAMWFVPEKQPTGEGD